MNWSITRLMKSQYLGSPVERATISMPFRVYPVTYDQRARRSRGVPGLRLMMLSATATAQDFGAAAGAAGGAP